MSASDALPVPRKNAAYRVYFPMLKNDGTVITGWTSPAASISKDGATAASASNTPTEIASSFGIGYLDLTSTEMNADCVVIKATVSNTGALSQVLVLYPQEAGDLHMDVDTWRGTTPNSLQSGRVDGYLGAAAAGVIAAAAFASGALDAVWERAASALTISGSIGKRLADDIDAAISSRSSFDAASDSVKVGDILAAALAKLFTTDSGETYADAVAGSAVKEIASNAGGGSGDQWLTDLASGYSGTQAGNLLVQAYLKALLITADNISMSAPTDPISGDLTLVRGDDYTVSSGRALPEWSSDDWTPFSLTTATVNFRARTRYSETVFEKAATVISDTSVRVEFTTAETGSFEVGRDAYSFDLEAVLATGDVVTLAQGRLSMIEDVR